MPQLYATNIQPASIAPIQQAIQQAQASKDLAFREKELEFRQLKAEQDMKMDLLRLGIDERKLDLQSRGLDLKELESSMTFADSIGTKFAAGDMDYVNEAMQKSGLSEAMKGGVSAQELVPAYMGFLKYPGISERIAKKSHADNMMKMITSGRVNIGRNLPLYLDSLRNVMLSPDSTVADIPNPMDFQYYDVYGYAEDFIAKNKDMTVEEKEMAITNWLTRDPEAQRQLFIDGFIDPNTGSLDGAIQLFKTRYAMSGYDPTRKRSSSRSSSSTSSGRDDSASFYKDYSLPEGVYSSTFEDSTLPRVYKLSTETERSNPIATTAERAAEDINTNATPSRPRTLEFKERLVQAARDPSRPQFTFSSTSKQLIPLRENDNRDVSGQDGTLEVIDNVLYIKFGTGARAVYVSLGNAPDLLFNSVSRQPTTSTEAAPLAVPQEEKPASKVNSSLLDSLF